MYKTQGITIKAADDATSVEKGETLQLTATVSPEDATDKSVSWSSSDENVATVDADGLVTAVAAGDVTITATTSGNQSADIKLTVTVATTGVTIKAEGDATTIYEGQTLQLTATVSPDDATDKTVTWSSSDEAVATVNADGLVSAVATGETSITAKTADGLTADYAVKVEKDPLTGLMTVSVEAGEVTVDNGTIIIGGNGHARVLDMSGHTVAVTETGRVSGLRPGIYLVSPDSGAVVKVHVK